MGALSVTAEPALPRAVRAADSGRHVRARRAMSRRSTPRCRRRPRRSSPSRYRAKAASVRCRRVRGGHRTRLHAHRRAAHRRRDPVRPGPHRRAVLLPDARPHARFDHRRQGDRLRGADGRGTGRRRVAAPGLRPAITAPPMAAICWPRGRPCTCWSSCGTAGCHPACGASVDVLDGALRDAGPRGHAGDTVARRRADARAGARRSTRAGGRRRRWPGLLVNRTAERWCACCRPHGHRGGDR